MVEIKFDKKSNKSNAYYNEVKIGECSFIEIGDN